jgi:hypothetical protein
MTLVNVGGGAVKISALGGGTLLVKDQSGAPSVGGVTTLVVNDTAAGLSPTAIHLGGGGGVAQVATWYATASQDGVVSTTTQTFGGAKTFSNDATFSGKIVGGGTAFQVDAVGNVTSKSLVNSTTISSDGGTFSSDGAGNLTARTISCSSTVQSGTGFQVGIAGGASGTFKSGDAVPKTVTVVGGIITSIV